MSQIKTASADCSLRAHPSISGKTVDQLPKFINECSGLTTMLKNICVLALSLAPCLVLGQQANLPDPTPPFQILKGKVQDPVLKVGTFYSNNKSYLQPSFWIGNKRIGVRELNGTFRADQDQCISVMVDNLQIMQFMFWGSYQGLGFGYPFQVKPGTEPQLTVDESARTITYSKQYLLPDGETSTFSYTLKGLTDSKVELSWDLGISQEKLNSLPKDFSGVGLWIPMDGSHKSSLVINKQQFKTVDDLTDKETTVMSGDGLDLDYSSDNPLQEVSLKLSADHEFSAAESRGQSDSITFRTSSKQRVAHDRMVIDFGVAAEKLADAPPPVGGVDFWARDALDVPAPTTRNLLPNPSFEQGLRYWRWWGGGGTYVPSNTPNYSISTDAKFGKGALWIRPTQGGQPMQSLPFPITKGKTYTVSFYGKAIAPGSSVTIGVDSAVDGSTFDWMKALSKSYPLTTQWTRTSFSFTADMQAACLLIAGGSNFLIDGIQVEEGTQATDFIAPKVEGNLLTSDSDNFLAASAPIDASFQLFGAPGLTGSVEFNLYNYYRETVFHAKDDFTLDKDGLAKLALPFDRKKLGTGIFVLKANYQLSDGAALRDYYRLSIMDFLENKHATKNLFSNISNAFTLTRGDANLRNYMRWGFGATTYGFVSQNAANLFAKYRITNFLSVAGDGQAKNWSSVPPDLEKKIEDDAYKLVKSQPWGNGWAFQTESEGKSPMLISGNFAEWAKLQLAFARGVKRANPNATVLPDGGTSGFGRLRGYREMGGYLAATEGKIKWDAIAVHPYGTLDGINGWDDFDVNIPLLQNLMKKYGYGSDTPIDFTEAYNITDTWIPDWGDNGCYDNYQADKPTYDWGWKEYLQAAWVARGYIMCLKYWPQVRSLSIWTSTPFLDQYFAPLALCKIPNTLGHLFPNPKFKADVRPAAGVRGYVFEDEQGRGVAAIWCAIDKVEEGLERGPELSVNFGGAMPEFIDLMGNQRIVKAEHGSVTIPLSPSPLFLRSASGGADDLAAALNNAEVSGSASALRVAIQPSLSGQLDASVSNLTNRALHGELVVGGNKIPFSTEPKGNVIEPLAQKVDPTPGKMYPWNQSIGVNFANGRKDKVDWNMSFFYVPHTDKPLPSDPAAPEWEKIPSVAVTNWLLPKKPDGSTVPNAPDALKASYQLAWDKDNLYLRVSGADNNFVLSDPATFKYDPSRDSQLYGNDGCLEVYFDTGANGRTYQVKGYNPEDYRYDFYAGNVQAVNGPGLVYRFMEPYHQLAGGLQMPSKLEASQGVKCQFQRTGNDYAYVVVFPRRYIEPLKLEAGWQAGFGLFLHDKDNPSESDGKGLSLATEPGVGCDARPDLWPIMILEN
jgi:hypothetical protein